MDNQNQDQSLGIELQVVQIQEMNFALDESLWTLKDIDRDDLDVQMGIKFQPIMRENHMSISVKVYYRYKIDGEMKPIMSIEIATLFLIVDMDKHIENKETQFNDKSNIIPSLLNVAIGATRGFLAAKVSGTILSKYPLPLMDVNEVLSTVRPQ